MQEITYQLTISFKNLAQIENIKARLSYNLLGDFVECLDDNDEKSANWKLVFYRDSNTAVQTLQKKLMDFFSHEEVEITLSSFSTAVWSKSWEENFDHFQTKDYLFSPPGKSHSVSTSKKILYIDPGAFGTGEHITTKLCLLMLEKISLTLTYKNSFLDIGTGSGILAAWAESEGFKDILATDICEDAIRSAKRTKELNRHSFEIKNQTLPATSKIFDIIVCNILPPELYSVFPAIQNLMDEKSKFIIAGFNESNILEIKKTCSQNRLDILDSLTLDGWIALALKKL